MTENLPLLAESLIDALNNIKIVLPVIHLPKMKFVYFVLIVLEM